MPETVSGQCVDVMRGCKREDLLVTLTNIFEHILPQHGYALRGEQLKLAKDILESMRGFKVSLSEAGVGIGKTHAYLIAAALIKRGRTNEFWMKGKYPGIAYIAELPIVVATSSIALQKAIIKDYIPEISKILRGHGIISKPLTAVIRKGREHYICERRLKLLWRQSARREIKTVLAPIVKGKGGIDLDEIDALDAYTKRRINVTGSCIGCSLRFSCRYQAFLTAAQSDKYDFQICNHNYLLADALHRAKGLNPLIPHYQAVIIDEAHKFLSAARSMYGTQLSSFTIARIVKTIRNFAFEQGQSTAALWRDADMLADQSKHFFRLLTANIPDSCEDDDIERFKTTIDCSAERCLHSMTETLAALVTRLTALKALPKYTRSYLNALRELEDIQAALAAFGNHNELIYWLESPGGVPDRKGTVETLLCAIPKGLGEMLLADLWGKGIPIVLTSGTLSAAGDFTHIKQSLGLDRLSHYNLSETSRASPFNYRENALIYISEQVPFPDNKNPQYIAAVADEAEKLIRAAHGHTVALFTSYRAMERVHAILKERGLPFPLFMMGRGAVNTVERFRRSGNGVLLATGSMWEGIDFPGDILSMLIIVKLPFSVPDPIPDHQQSLFKTAQQFKDAVIIPGNARLWAADTHNDRHRRSGDSRLPRQQKGLFPRHRPSSAAEVQSHEIHWQRHQFFQDKKAEKILQKRVN